MKQVTFVFVLLLVVCLSNAQTLFAQSSEQGLQELAQEMMSRVENPEQNLGLLEDIQDVLQPHSDFLFNTLPEMQTDPEFGPYIEKYEALKGQYMNNGQSMPVDPDVKVFLSVTPFPREIGYDESLIGTAVSFYHNSVIMIDRGFWEYYKGNDVVREVVLFHELGHCDLRQEHSHNDIMNMTWMDDVLTRKTIDWQPLYEEFFTIQQRYKTVVCSEKNSHFYEECVNPRFIFQPLVCRGEKSDTICYIWREVLVNEVEGSLHRLRCLLFNPDSSVCFGSL